MDASRIAYGFAANLLGIFVAALLGLVGYGESFFTLLFAAFAFGVINVLIRPVVTILSLPAIVLTFGLFIFVVNALMLWFTSIVVPGFEVFGFWQTVGAAVVVGVVNFILHALLKDIDRSHWDKAKKELNQ
ncbi:MAG: phage holin family protein [Patescibacteria group bacterium]